jgi:hypothetical protein
MAVVTVREGHDDALPRFQKSEVGNFFDDAELRGVALEGQYPLLIVFAEVVAESTPVLEQQLFGHTESPGMAGRKLRKPAESILLRLRQTMIKQR